MKEKIIEKIKKALALANNNKNPNEAQAAMLLTQQKMIHQKTSNPRGRRK